MLLLQRMRLEPVILQNVPIAADTIMEKLEANIDVRYACVLLTPDDGVARLAVRKTCRGHAQRLMNPREVVLEEVQRHRVGVVLDLL